MSERCRIRTEAGRMRQVFQQESDWNSNAFHRSLTFSLVCSALAVFIGGISVRSPHRESPAPVSAETPQPILRTGSTYRSQTISLGAFFAMVAGILTAISAANGWETRWHVNRVSRARVDALILDSYDPNIPPAVLRVQLKRIVLDQTDGIVSVKTQ